MIARIRDLMRWRRGPVKRALALAGGGVVGGMYEVGVLAALDKALPGFRANSFDLYVGASAGSVVASLLANGVKSGDLYQVLDEGLPDPMNFERGAVYDRRALPRAVKNLGRLFWAVGKHLFTGLRSSIPDLLAKAQWDLPAGFFSLDQLESFMRRVFAEKGLSNYFLRLPRQLLIPAVDLDHAERVVFGAGDLAGVPISQAIAASSAIPGFFEPYTIAGRDYVDGGVGYVAHADLTIDRGATLIVVVNPQVPLISQESAGVQRLKERGLYSILEQSSRITSQNLLDLGLKELKSRHPKVESLLLQPDPRDPLLFGPSMGFQASRAALRYGYTSTLEWLGAGGAAFSRHFATRLGVAGESA